MTAAAAPAQRSAVGRLLDFVEVAGNKVPHPVMMFLYLIIGVIVLSQILYIAGVSVTDEIVVPDTHPGDARLLRGHDLPERARSGDILANGFHLETVTIPIRGLLTTEGIRFIFTSFVSNFAGFGVVAVTFIALMGAGVAEAGGLMARADPQARGGVAQEAAEPDPRARRDHVQRRVRRRLPDPRAARGGRVHVRRAAPARRHGRCASPPWARCSGSTRSSGPIDAMITEITNEALGPTGAEPLTIVANWFFSIGSSLVLAVVVAFVTERMIEKRLGPFDGQRGRDGRRRRRRSTPPRSHAACATRWSRSSCSSASCSCSRSPRAPRSATRRPATSSARRRSWTACCSSSR